MAARHGTRLCYVQGCHCEQCRAANTEYERDRRWRRANGEVATSRVLVMAPPGPGRAEAAVAAQLEGLAAAEAQPGLAAGALAMGRVLDNPRLQSAHPPAAKVLAALLAALGKGSARHRRGGLAAVRAMVEKATPEPGA